MKRRFVVCGGDTQEISRICALAGTIVLKRIVILSYKKIGQISLLVADGHGSFISGLVGETELIVEKTLTITHCYWFIPVYTEYFSNVVTVQLEIGYHTQPVKTLQGH